MHTYPFVNDKGHLFVELPEGSFLVDTGAPGSFGNRDTVTLADKRMALAHSFMGLDAAVHERLVGRPTSWLLGADILNQFDLVFDVPARTLKVSTTPLAFEGEAVPVDYVLGVPYLTVNVAGNEEKLFFDTGAQVSYWQDDSLESFPSMGTLSDFYPGFGEFSTDTHKVPLTVGKRRFEVRCGRLPGMLGMTLGLAGVSGILGNEVLLTGPVAYLPSRNCLVMP